MRSRGAIVDQVIDIVLSVASDRFTSDTVIPYCHRYCTRPVDTLLHKQSQCIDIQWLTAFFAANNDVFNLINHIRIQFLATTIGYHNLRQQLITFLWVINKNKMKNG